jgi:hypothetical protein
LLTNGREGQGQRHGAVDVTSIPVTKKAPLSLGDNGALERARRDLNPQPPDRQSKRTEFEVVDCTQVALSVSDVSATVSPRTPETGHGSGTDSASGSGEQAPDSSPENSGFAAAVLAIMALPLTDDEKAEALRRLLASEQ